MKYIDADTLRAGIESICLFPQKSADYNDGREDMKMMVFDLIDSLQQEQPEVNIKKEIKDWCKENVTGVNPIYTADSLMCALLPKCACHFYELGRQAKPEIFNTAAFQKGVEEGRRLEREDVKSTIQSRIDEILGDAQPNPILRMELQELIKKIEA